MFGELKKEKLCSKRENKSLPPFFDHLGVTCLLAYIWKLNSHFTSQLADLRVLPGKGLSLERVYWPDE